MGVRQLLRNVQEGRIGRNVGISTGMPTIDSVIYGIQRKYLYTIGADTSGGKTSFAVDVFVYNLIKNAGSRPISILYYSFEMSSDILFAKMLSLHIFDTYGEIVTYEDILSLTKTISDEHLELIKKSEPWLYELQQHLTIYDKSLTPQGIYATCKEWLKQFGEFVQVDEHREEYEDRDSERYKLAIIDHVGLIPGQGSKKERIDLTVDYFIYFRNKCSLTGVFIQQMNRNAKSMDRKTNGYELYQLDDFKDTSGTTDASEIVFAIYFPFREKIARCEGYPIQNVLKKRFRLIQILKNRYGVADYSKGVAFYGEIGKFVELPKSEEIGDYEKYLTLDYLKLVDTDIDDDYESDKNAFQF